VKVLDAPSLQDDYYLNLLDWGSQNLMAVGLSSTVYLWNAATAKVNKLCDLHQHKVTSVSWGVRDPNIAVGGESGDVQIWDINKMSKIRTFTGHTHRVGSLNWSSSMLSSGSRDKNILNRDLRDSRQFISIFEGHKQEVCGLKWSPD
jgi:cell division cycle 20-like protein 1, cofactor of APC complex